MHLKLSPCRNQQSREGNITITTIHVHPGELLVFFPEDQGSGKATFS